MVYVIRFQLGLPGDWLVRLALDRSAGSDTVYLWAQLYRPDRELGDDAWEVRHLAVIDAELATLVKTGSPAIPDRLAELASDRFLAGGYDCEGSPLNLGELPGLFTTPGWEVSEPLRVEPTLAELDEMNTQVAKTIRAFTLVDPGERAVFRFSDHQVTREHDSWAFSYGLGRDCYDAIMWGWYGLADPAYWLERGWNGRVLFGRVSHSPERFGPYLRYNAGLNVRELAVPEPVAAGELVW